MRAHTLTSKRVLAQLKVEINIAGATLAVASEICRYRGLDYFPMRTADRRSRLLGRARRPERQATRRLMG